MLSRQSPAFKAEGSRRAEWSQPVPLMPGGRRGGTVAGPQRKGRPTASRDGEGTEGAAGREVPWSPQQGRRRLSVAQKECSDVVTSCTVACGEAAETGAWPAGRTPPPRTRVQAPTAGAERLSERPIQKGAENRSVASPQEGRVLQQCPVVLWSLGSWMGSLHSSPSAARGRPPLRPRRELTDASSQTSPWDTHELPHLPLLLPFRSWVAAPVSTVVLILSPVFLAHTSPHTVTAGFPWLVLVSGFDQCSETPAPRNPRRSPVGNTCLAHAGPLLALAGP